MISARTSANGTHRKLSSAGVSFLDVRQRPNLNPLEEEKANRKEINILSAVSISDGVSVFFFPRHRTCGDWSAAR